MASQLPPHDAKGWDGATEAARLGDGLRDIGAGIREHARAVDLTARELGPGVRQHAQALDRLARALEGVPRTVGVELRVASDQANGTVLFLVGVALLAGVVIGRLAGRFRP